MTPRLEEERARREGPATANLMLALLPWTAVVVIASVVRTVGAPGFALVLHVVAIATAPIVFIAWRRASRTDASARAT